MLDNSFAPASVQIEVGETVRFVNDGRVPHNAYADDGSWSTEESFGSPILQPGEETEITFDQPGTFPYFCSLHATQTEDGTWEGMVGTLVVGGEANAAEVVAQSSDAPAEWSGRTRNVPGDYPTIQSAVDAAEPGDLVLIAPGVYKEAVSVTTPGLVIRGTDRNAVILDGEFTRENGIAVTADGVAIENLTARSYTVNGFFWNGVIGYRGSYLTAIDDWVYGIYAFDSVDGLFEHSYASGSWDAGFYIGQCDPCNAVLTDSLAEFNGLGYSGTNSSGNIYIVDSEWRHNVAGIVPNTLDSELLPPVHDVVVAGNYIHDNGEDERAPNRTAEWSAFGNGVVLAGARDSVVRNNLIVNNPTSGVQVVTMIDKNLWPSGGNEVRDNVIQGSGRADLAIGGPWEQGSCIAGNEARSTLPFTARWLHDCDGINLWLPYGLATSSDPLGRIAQTTFGQNTQLEHGDAPKPDMTFDGLPGGAEAPVRPAANVFASLDFDPDAITTPELPAGVEIDSPRPVFLGVALDGGFWPLWLGALLWWIPVAAYVFGGLWALARIWKAPMRAWARWVWTAIVVLIPVIGIVFFALFGNRQARPVRRLLVGGGSALAWIVAVVASLLIGGIF